MPGIIDPQALNVNDLPTIWSPVQWELTDEERLQEVQDQGTASLLWAADAPETILRLLLNETEIDRALEPPRGWDPEQQGEWDAEIITYEFRKPIQLIKCEREADRLYVEYHFDNLGYWAFEIGPEEVSIKRI